MGRRRSCLTRTSRRIAGLAFDAPTSRCGRRDRTLEIARTHLVAGGCVSADKSLELGADLADAHAALAECLLARRRYTEARKALQAAIDTTDVESARNTYVRRMKKIP